MTTEQIFDGKTEQCDIEEVRPKSSKTFLYFAACTANLFAFGCGIAFGWTSPILPKLKENIEGNLPHTITDEDASWIGSLLPIGAAIGPFAAGWASEKLGRKKTIIASVLPMAVAFLIFAYATNVYHYYLGRLLCGFTAGGIFTVLPVYIAEIAEDENRGALASFMQFFIVVGITFSYITGPYIPMGTYNLLACLIIIISVFIFYLYIPETAHYYVSQKECHLAEKSLMTLRSASRDQIIGELQLIKQSAQNAGGKQRGFTEIFASPISVKALRLTFLLMVYQQFCGINVVLFYTENIFDATGSSIPPDISTIIIGFVQIISSAVTPMIVDKSGKRLLLMSSAIFMCLSETILGLYFYLKDIGNNLEYVFWLPIVCLIIYMVAYNLGMGPLPWAVMGELFPPDVKSAAATAIASSCWLMAFLLTKFFGLIATQIGNAGSFWIFAGFCAVGAVQIYKQLPETSGKSLQEIQDILADKK